MSPETRKYLLPFSTMSQNRVEPFSIESERAAVFSLAELERVKGGGRVMKQLPEKLAFIAEACYPLWLATVGKIGLLFDGLSITSHTFTYLTMPDTQAFLNNVNRSSKTRHAYVTFLSDNRNYFKLSGNEERRVIDGLITDTEFLNDFTLYTSEALPIKAPLSDMVLVSPTLDESLVSSITEGLQELKSKFAEEVKAFYSSMKLVNAKTESFMKETRNEIKSIKEKFSREIEKRKASITEKVAVIRREYDEKVTESSKKIEEELLSLHEEQIKLEKTKELLVGEIEHCEAEIKTHAINKDDLGELKWKEKRDQIKRQQSAAEIEIKELENKINENKDEKKLKIFALRSECDAKIKEAEKGLMEVESKRDAKIKIHEEEMEKLEDLTSSIIEKIDRLAKLREATITEFDKLGIQQKRKKRALFYIPFYLACYRLDTRKRYVYFPPSTVNSISLSVKFKRALGKAKIKQIFQSRSKTIVSLLNKFLLTMQQNAVFNREMNEACEKANIMLTRNTRETIRKGLKKIKEEGWISEREHESFTELLK